jgi:hypothetical protein
MSRQQWRHEGRHGTTRAEPHRHLLLVGRSSQVERRRAAAAGRNPSRGGDRRIGQRRRPGQANHSGGGVDQEVVVRLRPAAAAGATGVDRNKRTAARATPWASEARGRGAVVGRRSGLTDRLIESIGSGRVNLAEMGQLGQTGFGLPN